MAFRAAQVKYTQRYTPRWRTCNLLTDKYFTFATTLLYVNKHLPEDARKTVRYVCCPVYLVLRNDGHFGLTHAMGIKS